MSLSECLGEVDLGGEVETPDEPKRTSGRGEIRGEVATSHPVPSPLLLCAIINWEEQALGYERYFKD